MRRATFKPCSASGIALPTIKSSILSLSNCGKSAINFSITFAAITSGLVNLKLPFGALPTAVL